MDDISTRTIIIAVNIFVTLIIVSIIIIMFGQMRNIYGVVGTTDTSIYNTFDDVYSMYHGKKVTGIGLLNAIKKYEDNTQNIEVKYTGSSSVKEWTSNNNAREVDVLKGIMEKEKEYLSLHLGDYNYEDEYTVIVEEENNEEENNNVIIIDFEKINY